LIVSGFAYVHPNGQNLLSQAAIDSDDKIPGFKRLTREVHKYNTKIAMQLVHCGRHSQAVRKRGALPLAPSVLEDNQNAKGSYRAMTEADIEELVDAFRLAAIRAREAGFDAIQLHAAHSYLFTQFLSPVSNKRSDRWGGSLENRLRFHLQVVEAITKAIGPDFPLLIKLGVQDTVAGGLTLDEGCTAARMLSSQGIAAVEVSEGLETAGANHIKKDIDAQEKEAYYAAWARKVKDAVAVPVMLVGGLRSFDLLEKIVREGQSDFVSMCRPFIREPHLVNRWQENNRTPATCISCNLCLKRVIQNEPLECVQDRS
jgi:2,4-dienoyl-CoA reductase-like NADH-dependent reductase (Old Yellow Enzyme family)